MSLFSLDKQIVASIPAAPETKNGQPGNLLAGEKDLIQPAHTHLIARSLPKGEVQILPGLTHYAPQEDPAVFNAAVLEFLGRP